MSTQNPSYYVKRTHVETGRVGYVGSLRPLSRAEREAAAWRSQTDSFGGGWTAEVLPNTLEVRRDVRAWMQAVAERNAR